jgi:uncharacterized membrane protein YdbT with pleckstrin-like domain
MSQRDYSTIHPTVTKTFVKGIIAVAAFSLFLEIGPSNLVNYGIFLLVSVAAILAYMGQKRSSTFLVGEDGLVIKSPLRATRIVDYADITDISLSQGLLAKRFKCGTIFIFVKARRNGCTELGGSAVEALRDVAEPNRIYDQIVSKLSLYSRPP